MLFGLKHAGTIYYHLVYKLFEPLIGQTMKVYVDDNIVKSMRNAECGQDL